MLTILNINTSERISHLLGESWMFIIFIVLFVILALIRNSYSKNFKELFLAAVNIRLLREILREEIVLTSRASQLLVVLSLLSVPLFVYLCFLHWDYQIFDIQLSGVLSYLLLLALMVSLYFVKIFVLFFFKVLFGDDYSLTEYEFNYSLLLKLVGIILIPISLLLAYNAEDSAEIIVWIGWSVITLGLLWRWIRGLSNAFAHRISIVYIILYFCTLEIVPIAVMIKVLV